MKHMSAVPNQDSAATLPNTSEAFQTCMEQAEICCEQARLAGRSRRYKAACGLFSTAAALYKRATLLEGVSYHALEQRLNDVECEMAAYSELSRSATRPLMR